MNYVFDRFQLRNIFYKPYFMLYGEVYADEIDTCGDEAWDSHLENGVPVHIQTNSTSTCPPGFWYVNFRICKKYFNFDMINILYRTDL